MFLFEGGKALEPAQRPAEMREACLSSAPEAKVGAGQTEGWTEDRCHGPGSHSKTHSGLSLCSAASRRAERELGANGTQEVCKHGSWTTSEEISSEELQWDP